MSTHALLSPSSSHRWLECPPSARLEEQLPDRSSTYADEGTLAHELGAAWVQAELGKISNYEFQNIALTVQQNELYQEEMMGYVKEYVAECLSIFNSMDTNKDHAAIPMVEQRFDVTEWVPEGFGTSDFNVAAPGVLSITDLKYGKGVPVSAQDNPQLKIYALGVYRIARYLFNIKRVDMKIVQPRIDNTNSYSMKIEELLQWADNILKPAAKLAYNGEGEFKAGEHCRFCKAKSTCKALASYNQSLAEYDFNLPELLTEEEIADIVLKTPLFQNWLAAVNEYALQQAMKGRTFPGLKMVTGVSRRVISDEHKAVKFFISKGIESYVVMEQNLLPLGKLEKAGLPPKVLKEFLAKYVIKPKGKPTLVPVTDKRPANNSIQDAQTDFEHLKL